MMRHNQGFPSPFPHGFRVLMLLGCLHLFPMEVQARELPAEIASHLSRHNISPDSVSLVIRDVASGQDILSLNPDVPRNPASVVKLVTTIAALELLGPTYRWETRYHLDGNLGPDGRLRGNLVLQGGGDPFVSLERFWLHVLALRQRGIRHIDGNLIIDNTLLRLPHHDRSAFDNRPTRLYNVGPDAALINLSATSFVIEPEDDRIHVFADPPLYGLEIINDLTPARGRCISRNKGWSTKLERVKGGLQARFSGKYHSECGRHAISRSYFDNHEYTYRLFRSLWESMGGTFRGGYRAGKLPETARSLVSMESRTLAENVTGINKYSNNVMARLLLLAIGKEATPESSTDSREDGVRAVMKWLENAGLDIRNMIIDNGSGLSRITRMSASQIADLLSIAWQSNWRPEFLSSLSLTALDGTMRRRLQETELVGRARIKTGLIRNVRSMAGYVHANDGRYYSVTMMIHSPKIDFWSGNRIQDNILDWTHRRP